MRRERSARWPPHRSPQLRRLRLRLGAGTAHAPARGLALLVVALAFLTGNDVYYNNHIDNPSNADRAPYYAYEGDRLVLRNPLGANPF